VWEILETFSVDERKEDGDMSVNLLGDSRKGTYKPLYRKKNSENSISIDWGKSVPPSTSKWVDTIWSHTVIVSGTRDKMLTHTRKLKKQIKNTAGIK
jgi:hypothetical protein